ncbi:MAG: alanine racemase [Microthrixaceae bacterium]
MPRHARITVDLDAIKHNARLLHSAAPDSILCAVVKADGYGHGAIQAAGAALEGGATWLGVALVEEGVVLRDAGISVPILLLSEPPPDAMEDAFRAGLTPTLYTSEGIEAARSAARSAASQGGPWSVHVKVDTGMHRVGVDPSVAPTLARAVWDSQELILGGTFTHLAVADDPNRPETLEQLERFDSAIADIRAAGIDPGLLHTANSAGALLHRNSHFNLVRTGISLYGYPPAPEVSEQCGDLRPALALGAEVTMLRTLDRGEGISYGLRHVVDRPTQVAVVPLGYADGVDRRFGLAGGHVLIGGRRCPVRGVVTMDQMVVELPDDLEVHLGDEVVLIGTQGDETVTADEWAELLGTISYEVLCRFSARVPRAYV